LRIFLQHFGQNIAVTSCDIHERSTVQPREIVGFEHRRRGDCAEAGHRGVEDFGNRFVFRKIVAAGDTADLLDHCFAGF
jgi:hypothetical protein